MEIKWLWLSFVVDPLLIITFSLLGVLVSKWAYGRSKSVYDTIDRISDYMLKAVALTATAVGLSSFPQVFKAGPNGESMILIAFGCLVVGIGIGSWLNIDLRLENWVNSRFNKAKASRSNWLTKAITKLEESKFDKGKTFGWAAAYATYVSIVGVLSIMGPIHESLDGVQTFMIMKCVLDSVASLVFAINWGPGVLLSFVPVFIWQFAFGLGAPLIIGTLPPTVIAFLDGVGGVIIMTMGLSVAGVLKAKKPKEDEKEDKEVKFESFRTGNFLPTMLLAWGIANLAIYLKIFW